MNYRRAFVPNGYLHIIMTSYDRKSIFIENIDIYCGIGIGGKLMQQCISWCKDKNVTQIELSVVEDNKSAIAMYEAFGFKVTGTIPKAMRYNDGTFADEKLMVLEL